MSTQTAGPPVRHTPRPLVRGAPEPGDIRGPVRRRPDGRLVPNPARPASFLSQALLLDALLPALEGCGGRLLDVGCGARPYEWIYGTSAAETVGCDWPAEGTRACQPDVVTDACSLSFATAAFDTVVCTELLEHVLTPWACMAELSRVLRPGGRLILSVPFFYWVHEQPRDYYRYTPFALQALASAHGLRVVSLATRGGALAVALDLWGKWCWGVVRRLGARLPGGSGVEAAGTAAIVGMARLYLWLHRAGRRWRRGKGMAGAVTLGYVLVAGRDGLGAGHGGTPGGGCAVHPSQATERPVARERSHCPGWGNTA